MFYTVLIKRCCDSSGPGLHANYGVSGKPFQAAIVAVTLAFQSIICRFRQSLWLKDGSVFDDTIGAGLMTPSLAMARTSCKLLADRAKCIHALQATQTLSLADLIPARRSSHPLAQGMKLLFQLVAGIKPASTHQHMSGWAQLWQTTKWQDEDSASRVQSVSLQYLFYLIAQRDMSVSSLRLQQ
jgi:hypothetical protein